MCKVGSAIKMFCLTSQIHDNYSLAVRRVVWSFKASWFVLSNLGIQFSNADLATVNSRTDPKNGAVTLAISGMLSRWNSITKLQSSSSLSV